MTYALVPAYIIEWHRELLAALRVQFFPPGLSEMNSWRDFLSVMSSLKTTEGGEFTKRDLAAAVALMRAQNGKGSNWSLRFAKIMGTPESFRDLVLEARTKAKIRPRQPVAQGSRKVGDLTIATETDPAAEAAPQPISESVHKFMNEYRARKERKGK